jgi:hypothetical protein
MSGETQEKSILLTWYISQSIPGRYLCDFSLCERTYTHEICKGGSSLLLDIVRQLYAPPGFKGNVEGGLGMSTVNMSPCT